MCLFPCDIWGMDMPTVRCLCAVLLMIVDCKNSYGMGDEQTINNEAFWMQRDSVQYSEVVM